MALKYGNIWAKVKRDMKAEVTTSMDNAATLIQGVRRTKSAENCGRRMGGKIPYSKMTVKQEVISQERRLVKITFELMYEFQLKPFR